MRGADPSWLPQFASAAQHTDKFSGNVDHVGLLAAGLMGEAGSVIAELKKVEREREAYPAYLRRMREEIGDFLWYFVRLADVAVPGLVAELQARDVDSSRNAEYRLTRFLEFGVAVGEVLDVVRRGGPPHAAALRLPLLRVWDLLVALAGEATVALPDAAAHNTLKTTSRWPQEKRYAPLFDEGYPEEEQLPRRLDIAFRELVLGGRNTALLRCNGINFGDRLTDNIEDPDGYRYHDIFHFAYAVYLGWSPVVRALLRCKRKSSPAKDEGQDGARAGILEEAVSAIVFSRAKQLSFFDGIDHVDYDLLKMVREFTQGFEVETVPLWQWEEAIVKGYAIFRKLRDNRGGRVLLDLNRRELTYVAAH